MRAKYELEIDLGNLSYDLTGEYAGRWHGLMPSACNASGNSLLEVLQSAEIFTADSDSNEGPSFLLADAPKNLRKEVTHIIRNELFKLELRDELEKDGL